jgi:hypothetical protein
VNVSPLGSAPVSVSVGAGVPVAVTVNVPAVLSIKTRPELFALVIVGAEFVGAGFGWALFDVQPATKRFAMRAQIRRVRNTKLPSNRTWRGSISDIP